VVFWTAQLVEAADGVVGLVLVLVEASVGTLPGKLVQVVVDLEIPQASELPAAGHSFHVVKVAPSLLQVGKSHVKEEVFLEVALSEEALFLAALLVEVAADAFLEVEILSLAHNAAE